jgi:acyl dehydratase
MTTHVNERAVQAAPGSFAGGFKTASRRVTQADVDLFAALSGDHHPQHVDAEWSRSSIFGERVAHGMLVLSWATGLVPLDPDRVVALRRVEAKFKSAVRPGDEIHVEGRPTAAKRLDERHRLVTTSWRILNQEGVLVVRASVDVVWRDAEPAGFSHIDVEPTPGVCPL